MSVLARIRPKKRGEDVDEGVAVSTAPPLPTAELCVNTNGDHINFVLGGTGTMNKSDVFSAIGGRAVLSPTFPVAAAINPSEAFHLHFQPGHAVTVAKPMVQVAVGSKKNPLIALYCDECGLRTTLPLGEHTKEELQDFFEAFN